MKTSVAAFLLWFPINRHNSKFLNIFHNLLQHRIHRARVKILNINYLFSLLQFRQESKSGTVLVFGVNQFWPAKILVTLNSCCLDSFFVVFFCAAVQSIGFRTQKKTNEIRINNTADPVIILSTYKICVLCVFFLLQQQKVRSIWISCAFTSLD